MSITNTITKIFKTIFPSKHNNGCFFTQLKVIIIVTTIFIIAHTDNSRFTSVLNIAKNTICKNTKTLLNIITYPENNNFALSY